MVEEQISNEEMQKRIQLMKENCIFCKIINKEIDSKPIFEDDLCIAILDINPASKGHILLIPKEHYMMIPMVPDQVLGHLSVISKYLSDLLCDAFGCVDVSVFIANGAAAGQQSQHFMVHIIPKYSNTELDFDVSGEKLLEQEVLKLSEMFKQKLSSLNPQ